MGWEQAEAWCESSVVGGGTRCLALMGGTSISIHTHLYTSMPIHTHQYPSVPTYNHLHPSIATYTHPYPPQNTHLYPPTPIHTHSYPSIPTHTPLSTCPQAPRTSLRVHAHHPNPIPEAGSPPPWGQGCPHPPSPAAPRLGAAPHSPAGLRPPPSLGFPEGELGLNNESI